MSAAATSVLPEVTLANSKDCTHLEKLLAHLYSESPHFADLIQHVLRSVGGRLSLIIYCDGLTPGAALAHDNKRKSVVWYGSFLEFGYMLQHEELWWTICSKRLADANRSPAGISGITRGMLRDMFVDQGISTRGIKLAGQIVRISFHALLADEEALNACWGIKGASGIVPCAIMCSVVGKPPSTDVEAGLPSLAQRSALIQDIGCSDIKRIGLKSDADVWALADEVAASHGTTRLKVTEKSRGINYHGEALLFDLELRRHVKPATCNRFDAMHILYSSGVLSQEVMLLLNAVKDKHGYYFKELREFLAPWRYPKARVHNSPADVFNVHRESSSKETLKAGASELLSVYPGLRYFVVEAFAKSDKIQRELTSLLSLTDICDLCTQGMHCRTAARAEELATRLEQAIPKYLESFKGVYGERALRFKHHLLMHLPAHLRADGRLLTCFTLERKHVVSKQCFNHYKHAEKMPVGALARMLNAQVLLLLLVARLRCRPPMG